MKEKSMENLPIEVKEMVCPCCQKTFKCQLDYSVNIITVKEKTFEYCNVSWKCLNCNQLFDTSETLDASLESAKKLLKEL